MALQFVAPGKDKLRPNILDERRLEIVQLLRVIRAVIKPQRVPCSQRYLLQLEIDSLVDSFDELCHTSVHTVQRQILLGNLGLKLAQEVGVQRLLRLLHLVEELQYLSFARVRCHHRACDLVF